MPRLLRRFWLTLLAALATFATLTYALSPRPITTTTFNLHRQVPNATPEEALLSLNGGLATLSKDDSSCLLTLTNLATGEVLFQTSGRIGPIRHDLDGGLVWIVADQLEREQLFRWDPQTREPRLVAECPYLGDMFELPKAFHRESDNRIPSISLLAPNGRTWVIPQVDDHEAWYEVIEVPKGTRRRLALPQLSLRSPVTTIDGMCFSEDSRTLLVQTQTDPDNVRRHQLHWLDVSTGQLQHTAPLPQEIHRIVYATDDLVVAQPHDPESAKSPFGVFLFRGPTKSVAWFSFNEIASQWKDLAERWPFDRDPKVDLQLAVDTTTQSLIAGWTYYDESQFYGGPLKTDQELPLPIEFHYSVRTLSTGTLQRTGTIPFRPNTAHAAHWQMPRLLAVTPGPTLLVNDTRFDPKDGPAGWLDYALARLGLPVNTHPDTIVAHDAPANLRLATLALPFGWWNATHAGNTLTLLDRNGTILTYAYPLHKPWLLILSWTTALTLATTLLTESLRHRRLRSHRSNPYQSLGT